eukprot:12141723-Alexandrium_andersonii.AAC.1
MRAHECAHTCALATERQTAFEPSVHQQRVSLRARSLMLYCSYSSERQVAQNATIAPAGLGIRVADVTHRRSY